MFRWTLPLLFWVVFACQRRDQMQVSGLEVPTVPLVFRSISDEKVSSINDVVYYSGKEYSGFLVEINENKDTLSKLGYYRGHLNGVSKKWYPNHQLMEERHFVGGEKHGKQISFWDNGNKRFEFVAKNDAYEGELKEWNYNGTLFHLGNFVNGQEEGAQKMWYDNGKIRANYVILKGKRYGLLGTKNCKNVSDSIFVVR